LYEEKWDLTFDEVLNLIYGDRSEHVKLIKPGQSSASHSSETCCTRSIRERTSVLFDLRTESDFNKGHLPGAVNLQLLSLRKDTPGPFDHSSVLEAQWKEMNAKFCSMFPQTDLIRALPFVVVLCYQGDTARVASSILRAKNIEAYSVKGGTLGLQLFSDG
jgi:rhodanese-related sulfurtransferase